MAEANGGISLVSDGFIPFRDNIDHASKHGVTFVAEPGGSSRSNEVWEACEEYGMTLVHTGFEAFPSLMGRRERLGQS